MPARLNSRLLQFVAQPVLLPSVHRHVSSIRDTLVVFQVEMSRVSCRIPWQLI